MDKIILLTLLSLCSTVLWGINKKTRLQPVAYDSYVDTIPRSTMDSAYAQKQMAYYKDSPDVPHFDTLTASAVFKQMDSTNMSKAKTDSTQKIISAARKKKKVRKP